MQQHCEPQRHPPSERRGAGSHLSTRHQSKRSIIGVYSSGTSIVQGDGSRGWISLTCTSCYFPGHARTIDMRGALIVSHVRVNGCSGEPKSYIGNGGWPARTIPPRQTSIGYQPEIDSASHTRKIYSVCIWWGLAPGNRYSEIYRSRLLCLD